MSGTRPSIARRHISAKAKAANSSNSTTDDLEGLRGAWSSNGFFGPGSGAWQSRQQSRTAQGRSTFSHAGEGRQYSRMARMFADLTFAGDSDDESLDDIHNGLDWGAGPGLRHASSEEFYTLALGGWMSGGTDAHGRSIPNALDPSQHSLSTDGALAQAMARSPTYRNFSSPILRNTAGRGHPARRMLGGRMSREHAAWDAEWSSEPEDPFASWEAKWTKLLSAEEETMRMKEARLAETSRRREAAAAAAAASRARAAQRVDASKHKPNFAAPPRYDRTQPPQSDRKAHASSAVPPPSAPLPPSVQSQCQPTQKRFASWSEYEAAWAAFEAKPAGSSLKFSDIPWPCFLSAGISVLGPGGTSGSEAKKRVFAALRRWHPDKWQAVFEQIVPGDLEAVKCRVKEVTEEILAAKARAIG